MSFLFNLFSSLFPKVFKHAEVTNILKNQQQKNLYLISLPRSHTCRKSSSAVKQSSLIISNSLYLDLLAAVDRITFPSLKSFLSYFLSLATVILQYSGFPSLLPFRRQVLWSSPLYSFSVLFLFFSSFVICVTEIDWATDIWQILSAWQGYSGK